MQIKKWITAKFNRYLKNTTIFKYQDESNNIGPNKHYWPEGSFSIQSFIQFIERIIKKYQINNSEDLVKNIYAIYQHTIDKKNIIDPNELDWIKSVFINLSDFLKKVVIWEKIDNLWPIPSYTNTDAKNVYCSIWNDTIKRIFWKNKNIEKIRQTRNKFIEHNEDHQIDKHGNDFRRKVSLIWWWDNFIWKINMKIHIDNEEKDYKFSLCPLLDFCIFIKEILKTTECKNKKLLIAR